MCCAICQWGLLHLRPERAPVTWSRYLKQALTSKEEAESGERILSSYFDVKGKCCIYHIAHWPFFILHFWAIICNLVSYSYLHTSLPSSAVLSSAHRCAGWPCNITTVEGWHESLKCPKALPSAGAFADGNRVPEGHQHPGSSILGLPISAVFFFASKKLGQ